MTHVIYQYVTLECYDPHELSDLCFAGLTDEQSADVKKKFGGIGDCPLHFEKRNLNVVSIVNYLSEIYGFQVKSLVMNGSNNERYTYLLERKKK